MKYTIDVQRARKLEGPGAWMNRPRNCDPSISHHVDHERTIFMSLLAVATISIAKARLATTQWGPLQHARSYRIYVINIVLLQTPSSTGHVVQTWSAMPPSCIRLNSTFSAAVRSALIIFIRCMCWQSTIYSISLSICRFNPQGTVGRVYVHVHHQSWRNWLSVMDIWPCGYRYMSIYARKLF